MRIRSRKAGWRVSSSPPLSHQVGHQLTVQRKSRRFAYSLQIHEAGFDLPQLDAEAADLHLMVGTPHVLDHAVTASARQVAGPVEPRARFAEGVGQEALGGQAGPIVVGTGQPGTAGNIKLAYRPYGQ